MGYGFKAINPTTGAVQVDENYFNLALITKVNITTSPIQGGASIYEASYTVTSSTPPVLGYRCDTRFVRASRVVKSGTSWTFYFRSGDYVDGDGSATITVYVFNRPSGGATGYGIKVLDASSNMNFTSSNKYARIIARLTGTYGTNSPPSTGRGPEYNYGNANLPSLALTAGKDYCIMWHLPSYYYVGQDGAYWVYFELGYKIASNTLTSKNQESMSWVAGPGSPGMLVDRRGYDIFVLDVTGY